MALSSAKGTISIAAGATGTHTVSGLSFQPKAVMFFGAHTNTTGSYVADEDVMFGAATSSTQEWVIHASSNNQATNTLTSRGHSNAACIRGMINGAPAAIDFAADFTGFTSDGFTVNVSNAPTNALTIHYLAFGGTDIVNAKAGSITIPTAGSLAFTDPGFNPDMVLFAHTWPDGANYRFTLGATDGTNAKMLHYGQISGSATVQSASVQKTGSYFSGATNAFGPDMDIGFVSLDATGFTLGGGTPDYPAAAQTAFYLAIEGGQWAVGVDTEGTAAAAKDTTLSFTPKGLLLFGTNEVTSTAYRNTVDGKLSIGASDGTNEGVIWNGNDDAHTDNPSFKRNDVARAFWHANPATAIAGPPTTVNEADATFASNKFTLTWTQAGSSREFIYLAAGDAPAGGGPVTLTPGAITALASAPAPVVLARIAPTAPVAFAAAPAPVVRATMTPTAALAVAAAPAPTKLVTIFPPGASSTAAAPGAVAGVTVILSAPTALASAPAVSATIVVPTAAAAALAGADPPVVLAVIPIGPAVAVASAPTPTVQSGAGVTASAAAAVATASAPAPTVNIAALPVVAAALASAPSPSSRIVVPVAVILASASAPTPTVVTGTLLVPGDATVADASTYSAAGTVSATMTATGASVTGYDATVADSDVYSAAAE